MSSNSNSLSRRDLLKTAVACGAGSVLAAAGRVGFAQAPAATAQAGGEAGVATVPRRPFGKTGVDVSILSLGGIFDITANQLVLKQSLRWGIDYWDTAASYTGGKSELGIGMFLEANPDERKRIFLVTKSKDGPGVEATLQQSLERMKTDYVDLFFIHGVRRGADVKANAARWKALAQKLKASGKIRFFGFSSHSNMADCLLAASKVGFIDGIMFTYNFRTMTDDATEAAVEAAHKAGIGLAAMKTQAKPSRRSGGETELALLDQFTRKGYTPGQAAVKAVWEDERIAAVCSAMYNLGVLQSNYLAAIDKTHLSPEDRQVLRRHAEESCSGYCAGCADVCQQVVAGSPPIADVMRYLMYHREYGMVEHARQLFAELPAATRAALTRADYSAAEQRCPQRIAIAAAMREASRLLV